MGGGRERREIMDKIGRVLNQRESFARILRGEGVAIAPWARYLLTVLLTATALAARIAMLPVNGGFAFVTFYPTVIVSALLFGLGSNFRIH